MNIMQITSGMGMDGATGHCLLLTREMAMRGHQLTLLCRPESWISKQFDADDDVEVITSDLHRWPRDEVRRIAKICRTREIDVTHTHMTRAHKFGVLLRRFAGVPCVATAHNRYLQLHWMFNDQVIAVCESARCFHRRYNLVGKKQIETIYNFIDYQRFANVPETARRKIRAEFNLDDNTPLVGEIGHIFPRKGQLHLIRALPAVLEAHPDTRLLLVGFDSPDNTLPYVAQVKREAQKLGVDRHVIWAGLRSDVPEILSAVDVFVLPSLEEQHPLTILEAWVREVPVVASAVGGVPEAVKHGETGMLVPPADPPALAAAIVRLLGDSDLRRHMGAEGHRHVKLHYSAESQLPKIENVLHTAALRRPAGLRYAKAA